MPKNLIVTGKSGTGKSTLIKNLMTEFPHIIRVIPSHTTRNPRIDDLPGDYIHDSRKKFIDDLKAGLFLFHVEQQGELYGVHIPDIEQCLNDAQHVYVRSLTPAILNLWHQFTGDMFCFLHLDAASDIVLTRRMLARGDKLEKIEAKLQNEICWDHEIGNLNQAGFPVLRLPSVCAPEEILAIAMHLISK